MFSYSSAADSDNTSDTISEYESLSDEPCEENFCEIQALRRWAIESQIPHTHLDTLLGILRRKLIPQLPKSLKIFMKTSNSQPITAVRNSSGEVEGKFVYFGIRQNLQRLINPSLHEDRNIALQFNIDGLPLFKSSRKQFWPILCQIFFNPSVYPVFPVAIYEGDTKPSDLRQYFEKFIDEVIELLEIGVEVNNIVLKVSIKSFICDRPARSMIKSIKGHGGYYACERCTIPGQRHNKRTVYVGQDFLKRHDSSFRSQQQSEHHIGLSPLTRIPGLDMVYHFSLDFMHLCCLGVMKKFLNDYWIEGNRQVKLSHSQKYRLSAMLLEFQSQIPIDFQRTTRTLNNISKWKATEYRFFLLYALPILLKDILPEKLYNHFMLFHVGCRILCSDEFCSKYIEHAATYLRMFVSLGNQLYGIESQILNMHSLIHLADDVKVLSCSLSHLTAFPFESALGRIKKCCELEKPH